MRLISEHKINHCMKAVIHREEEYYFVTVCLKNPTTGETSPLGMTKSYTSLIGCKNYVRQLRRDWKVNS